MPAVIYARISQDRDGEGLGTGRQIEDCQALADRLGLTVVQVINDNDVSAYSKRRRTGYDNLMKLIKGGAVDSVIAHHPDRLYRRFQDLNDLIDAVEHNRLTIHTVSAGDLDLNTSSGRMMARMLGAAAAGEVERKAERQARQKLEVAQRGGFNGGRQPLGYKRDGVTIDESRAPALREAAARLLSGHSLASCARYVSKEFGTAVKPRALRDALTAPRIAGLRQYWSVADRTRWKDSKGVASDRPNGRPSGMTVVQAEWEGIISVSDWGKVKAVLDDPKRRSGQSPRERSLLGGLLTCGGSKVDGSDCNKGMGYSAASYKCMASVGGCGRVSVSTRGVETLITTLMSQTLAASDILVDDELPLPPRTATERGRLQSTYDELLALWREGVISRAELGEQRAVIAAQLEMLEDAESESTRRAVERKAAIAALGRWEELQDDRVARAVAIRAVFDGIRILPSKARHASGPKFDRSRLQIKWAGSDAWVPVP
jgi:site-specific DNA recombinase